MVPPDGLRVGKYLHSCQLVKLVAGTSCRQMDLVSVNSLIDVGVTLLLGPECSGPVLYGCHLVHHDFKCQYYIQS